MGSRSNAVSTYIRKSQPFAQPILTHLRELIHDTCPGVEETIKWGMPHFVYRNAGLCHMAGFKAHAAFGFWKHGLLAGGPGAAAGLNRTGMGSFGRLTSLEDLPGRRALAALIRRAMKLNEQGVKRPTRSKPGRPVVVRTPPWLMAALRRNATALATYQGLPPGHRREYVQWLTEAKTDGTRAKRLATAVAWLSEGKRRNWKYEKK